MDTLVAVGVGAAYVLSAVTLAQGGHDWYFETAAVIVTLILLGQYLEAKARRGTNVAIDRLRSLAVSTARVIGADGVERDVDVASLKPGDVFIVRAGEKAATDGEVVAGESTFDEAMLTGESMPVVKRQGALVYGATTNVGQGQLRVRCTKVATDTMLARIVSFVESAQGSKAEIQRLADRIAAYFVPIVIGIAALTWLGWWWVGGATVVAALFPAIAVLVIACPCALGLATPTAVLAGTGRAAADLILIRSAAGLEQAHAVNAVIFDKTGTLTEGRPTVTATHLADGVSAERLWSVVLTLESLSLHPLAIALQVHAKTKQATSLPVRDGKEVSGLGVQGVVQIDGAFVPALIGSERLVQQAGIAMPDAWIERIAASTASLMVVAIGGQAAALIEVDDPLRASSAAAVNSLLARGMRLVMATGDRAGVAQRVAKSLGITDVRAAQSPIDKAAIVTELKRAGATVAVVGDGINDAPALVAADVGIAVGGVDVAMDAAAIVIPHGDLAKVATAVAISQRTMTVIKQNLGWAFVYNVLAIPLAAAGQLSPMIAAGAMAVSSVSVVVNSLRLSRWRNSDV
jgi:Cu+-exporting ATPase